MSDAIKTLMSEYIKDPQGIALLEDVFKNLSAEQLISQEIAIEYRQLCDALPVGVVTHNKLREVVYNNPISEKILGLTAAQMNETTPRPHGWKMRHEDGSVIPPTESPMSIALTTGKHETNIPVVITKPYGRQTHVLMSSVPIVIDESIRGVFTAVTDFTDQQVADRSHLLTDFMREASHQFRAPLNEIHDKVYDMMRKHEQLADSQDVMFINNSLEQLNALIDKLELITKLDEHSRWTIRVSDLYKLVARVVEGYRRIYAGRILLESEQTRYDVLIHDDLAVQALKEVLSNAITFSPNYGDIIVRLRPVDRLVFVDVIDQGIGMSDDMKYRVYERFYRQETPRSRRGFGLGLSVVKQIMDLHTDELHIKSKPNEGTTVTMGFNRMPS
ncbi:MAG: PAS domain-containing sensor histidine kinase [Chloroflexota bacterium]